MMIYGKIRDIILLHHSKTIPQSNEFGFQTNNIAFGSLLDKSGFTSRSLQKSEG